jgi:hypothetical protein
MNYKFKTLGLEKKETKKVFFEQEETKEVQGNKLHFIDRYNVS